jgi:TonB family protein
MLCCVYPSVRKVAALAAVLLIHVVLYRALAIQVVRAAAQDPGMIEARIIAVAPHANTLSLRLTLRRAARIRVEEPKWDGPTNDSQLIERPVPLSAAVPNLATPESPQSTSLTVAGRHSDTIPPRLESDRSFPLANDFPVPISLNGRERIQVVLAVLVWPNGSAPQVRLESSSGSVQFDAAALRYAGSLPLKPGTRNGVAVAMWGSFVLIFDLRHSTVSVRAVG